MMYYALLISFAIFIAGSITNLQTQRKMESSGINLGSLRKIQIALVVGESLAVIAMIMLHGKGLI